MSAGSGGRGRRKLAAAEGVPLAEALTHAVSEVQEPKARLGRSSGLHERILGELRRLVSEGALAPGEHVPERVLCERFAVSRTPLREALKVLAAEGLVELQPNRGARIALLTVEEVRATFEVIAVLEALAGELACLRVTEAELAEIKSLHFQMHAHYLRREMPEYFRLNRMIHERIIAAAGNPVLADTYRALNGRVVSARYLANMSEERWAQAMQEHQAILDLLVARDVGRLSALLKHHVLHKLKVVVAEFTRSGDSAAEAESAPAA